MVALLTGVVGAAMVQPATATVPDTDKAAYINDAVIEDGRLVIDGWTRRGRAAVTIKGTAFSTVASPGRYFRFSLP